VAEIEIEGKTVEEAIEEGLAKLGVTKDKVNVKILSEGAAGLFGLMGNKPAMVKLTTKDGSGAVDLSQTQTKAKEAAEKILQLMGLTFTDITASVKEDGVSVEVKSKDSKFIIGKNGQTLDALEHVLNLVLNKNAETRTRISLDTERYRKQQEERLDAMANKAAETVSQTGKVYRFEPMPSRDRRIIHLILKDNPDVETFSEGDGNFRKVVVKLKK